MQKIRAVIKNEMNVFITKYIFRYNTMLIQINLIVSSHFKTEELKEFHKTVL